MEEDTKDFSFHGLQLLQYCGGGAFGEVYFCTDISGKEMAVKIISKRALGDAWKRELKGLSNYRKITEDSPCLLQIFHVQDDDECLFYTMQAADSLSTETYIPDTLTARLANGPLPDDELFPTILSIFDGIESIHATGFAHRDIKPDNILFIDGLAKLGDIGLVANASRTTISLAGTLDFIPPEARSGESSDVKGNKYYQQNDLYAFGKVIYCSITGQEPQNFPSIPVEIELSARHKYYLHLAFRLCAKNPAQRLKSLAELKKELFHIEEILIRGESPVEFFWSKTKDWGRAFFTSMLSACQVRITDPARCKVQTYYHPDLKITMQIPAEWSILQVESVKKYLKTKTDLSDAEKERVKLLGKITQSGPCFIYCDYNKKFPDNCFIEKLSIDETAFETLPDDLLNFQVRKMFKDDMGEQTEIYDIQKLEITGHFCIRAEVSLNPDLCRSIFYLFFSQRHCISIAINCRLSSYARRKIEFEKAIKTCKIIQ